MKAPIRVLCCAIFVSVFAFGGRSSAQSGAAKPQPPASPAQTPADDAAPATPAAAPKAEAEAKTEMPAAPDASAGAESAPAAASAEDGAAQDEGPPAQESMADTAARARARAALLHAQARQREWEARARARARRANGDFDDRDAAGDEPRVYGDAGAAFAIGFQLALPWNTDPSYDVFSEDDVQPRLGAFVGYDLVSLQRDLILAAEVGWAMDSAESSVFNGALDSELQQHWFHAGASVRWVLWPWLQPHARLQGGVSWTDIQLDAGGTSFEDDAFAPFGNASAGVLLRTPTRLFENRRGRLASLSFGLLLEGGYTLAAPIDVELDGPGPRKNDIALTEASLGELRRSGPFARASLVARF